MTAIATVSISEYANAVRAALSDLPPLQSRAVLEGLDEHLAEIASEGAEDLEASLGTPEGYAAELRASAGFEASIVEPIDKPTTVEPSSESQSNKRSFSFLYGHLMARVISVGVFGILTVLVIRISYPLNGIELIAGTALAAGGWWLLRMITRKAEFSPAVATRLPAALAVAALLTAGLAGGGFAGNRTVYVSVTSSDRRAPRTTPMPVDPFGRPDVGRKVPNLIGESYENAVPMLAALGLRAEMETSQGGVSIVAMNPAPGMLVPFETIIRLTTGPALAVTPVPSTAGPDQISSTQVIDPVPAVAAASETITSTVITETESAAGTNPGASTLPTSKMDILRSSRAEKAVTDPTRVPNFDASAVAP